MINMNKLNSEKYPIKYYKPLYKLFNTVLINCMRYIVLDILVLFKNPSKYP